MGKKSYFTGFALLLLLAAMVAPSVVGAQDEALFSDPDATDEHCGFTDETAEGPFYLSETEEVSDLNIQAADGDMIEVSGVVYDGETGEPIPNAHIEVWNADADGNYLPAEEGEAEDFDEADINLRGTVISDDEGAYAFSSLMPGAVDDQAPAINYRITAEGYFPLFTQTYWADADMEAAAANANAENMVEPCRYLTFEEVTEGDMATLGAMAATFDIYLRPDPDYVPMSESTTEACPLLNLNNVTEEALLETIPDMSERMVDEFFEYRPYVSIQQFEREIGKYLDEAQIDEYMEYVYVPVDVNDSDAATLIQIPGVDQTIADELIAGRPYDENEEFIEALEAHLDEDQLDAASCLLTADA